MTNLLEDLRNKRRKGKIRDLVYPVSNTYNFSKMENVIFINTGDIHDGNFLHHDLSDIRKLPGQAKKSFEKGDILYSEIRPKNKHFAFVDFDASNYVASTKLIVLKNQPGIDPEYAYIVLTASKILNTFQEIAESRSGTFPQITFDSIADYEIFIPDLDVQKKIVAIVGSYNKKKENNIQIIKNLEAIAQAIFDEWFVKFCFPGHEKVKFVDSELGEIPEGWRIRMLTDIAQVTMGQSPKSEYYNDSGEGLPFHQGVTYFNHRYPTNSVYTLRGDKKAHMGDVLLSVRAPVGRINLANSEMIIGRGLCSLHSKTEQQSYLFYLLKHIFHEENIFGSGSIFPAINKNELESLKIIYPDDEAIYFFESRISTIDKKIHLLTNENIILNKMRDISLRKII